MKNFSCIAIDDEPIALTIITQFCERLGCISLSTYTNPLDGLKAIEQSQPDIVFLDIEMQELNGLSLAKTLPSTCTIIFTTAHVEYAHEGFNLDAADFLHKPFAFDRFEVAIEKAKRHIAFKNNNSYITIMQEYKKRSIPTNDIIYVEAMENYSKIHLDNSEVVISRINLKSIIKMLPNDRFIRIHRSFVVNKDKVTQYTKRELQLSNGSTLPLGRQYLKP